MGMTTRGKGVGIFRGGVPPALMIAQDPAALRPRACCYLQTRI
jgi:hypothetical protein